MSSNSEPERLVRSYVTKYFVSMCHQIADFKESVVLHTLTLILYQWSLGCGVHHMWACALKVTAGLTEKVLWNMNRLTLHPGRLPSLSSIKNARPAGEERSNTAWNSRQPLLQPRVLSKAACHWKQENEKFLTLWRSKIKCKNFFVTSAK